MSAGVLRGLERLAERPLTRLSLGGVLANDGFRRLLAGVAPTLEHLALTPAEPIEPDMLPELQQLSALKRAHITIFPGQGEGWLEYAVAHPEVVFRFARLAEDSRREQVSLACIHRGIDILRIEKKKKVAFEVSGDLAADFGLDDNEALEAAAACSGSRDSPPSWRRCKLLALRSFLLHFAGASCAIARSRAAWVKPPVRTPCL